MYNITDKNSFETAQEIKKTVKGILPKEAVLVLIGNRTDEENLRQVSTEEGRDYAEKSKMMFYELSLKNDVDIANKIFSDIVKKINGMNILLQSFKEIVHDDEKNIKHKNCGNRCSIF